MIPAHAVRREAFTSPWENQFFDDFASGFQLATAQEGTKPKPELVCSGCVVCKIVVAVVLVELRGNLCGKDFNKALPKHAL